MSDKNYRREIENYFIETNRIEIEREIVILPSGKYKLIIDGYKADPEYDYPHFSKAIVKQLKEESIIADIKWWSSYFFYHWIIHPNQNEYLLCEEINQAYTIINLSKRVVHRLPKKAVEGRHFFWADVYSSPNKLILAVGGYIWGMQYEVRFYDFSNPDVLPLKELDRFDEYSVTKVIGWEDNNTLVVKVERRRRKSDNKLYEELSPVEQDELDYDVDELLSIKVEETMKLRTLNPLV